MIVHFFASSIQYYGINIEMDALPFVLMDIVREYTMISKNEVAHIMAEVLEDIRVIGGCLNNTSLWCSEQGMIVEDLLFYVKTVRWGPPKLMRS